MVEAGEDASLGEEAGAQKLRTLPLGTKHLHGAANSERRMLDLVHLCHAALPEQTHDTISANVCHAFQPPRSGREISYIASIASLTFFGASSNWSVSIEYDARPFVRERIAVE